MAAITAEIGGYAMEAKRCIPGTNPKWGRRLKRGFLNSLVDENGYPYDNGCNFDEKDDDYDDIDEAFDRPHGRQTRADV